MDPSLSLPLTSSPCSFGVGNCRIDSNATFAMSGPADIGFDQDPCLEPPKTSHHTKHNGATSSVACRPVRPGTSQYTLIFIHHALDPPFLLRPSFSSVGGWSPSACPARVSLTPALLALQQLRTSASRQEREGAQALDLDLCNLLPFHFTSAVRRLLQSLRLSHRGTLEQPALKSLIKCSSCIHFPLSRMIPSINVASYRDADHN